MILKNGNDVSPGELADFLVDFNIVLDDFKADDFPVKSFSWRIYSVPAPILKFKDIKSPEDFFVQLFKYVSTTKNQKELFCNIKKLMKKERNRERASEGYYFGTDDDPALIVFDDLIEQCCNVQNSLLNKDGFGNDEFFCVDKEKISKIKITNKREFFINSKKSLKTTIKEVAKEAKEAAKGGSGKSVGRDIEER